MIGLENYKSNVAQNGFDNPNQAQDLIKAMQAGQITGRDTTDAALGQEPLKAESLETTLKLLEYRMKDIVLWNNMPKLTAYNTVEEYLQLESYGTDRGGFYNEGELSDVEDSVYKRRAQLVKYIQVTGEVTMQAQMVRSYVDAMRQEVENKTMWVTRKVNGSLTKADSAIIPQEFNGLYAQHASIGATEGDLYANLNEYQDSETVIDLRGASLTQDDVEDAAVNIDANFGNVSHLFAPPTVLSGLSKDFFDKQRLMLGNTNVGNVTGGTVIKSIATSFGDVALAQDKLMRRDGAKTLSNSATSLKAPNKPSAVGAAVAAGDASSRFAAADVGDNGALGAVFYAVSAINRYGESALEADTTKVTLAAGSSIDTTVTDGGGAVPATGYIIYRSLVSTSTDPAADGVKFYPLFKVSKAQLTAGYDGGAAGVIRDRGRFIPNCEEAFTTEMVTEVLSFKQLAPLSKLDLAILGMSNRFIAFLFGTPVLYTPKKMVRFINVGPYVRA